MSESQQHTAEPGQVRRKANNQIAGDAQLYYDVERDEPVVLRQDEGWGLTADPDYLDRTWRVLCVRDHLWDAECRDQTISQSIKLERVKTGRYQNLSDDDAERLLEDAAEANREWMKVHVPHIPFSGDGGVNVYAAGERLKKVETEEDAVLVRDDAYGAAVPDCGQVLHVRVEYDEDGIDRVEAADGAEDFRECDRASAPEGVQRYAPPVDLGPVGLRIELRHDTECTDPHEWDPVVEPLDRGGGR